MRKLFILTILAMAVVGCNSSKPESSIVESEESESFIIPSESESSMSEFGELIIKDIPFLYYEMGPQKLDITFTDPDFEEEITYKYQSTLFKIEDGYIVPLKSGSTTAYVTATTSHHSVKFKVNMPSINGERYDRAVNYASDIVGKVDSETTVFLGDSIFDVAHFWKDFYTKVTGNRYICGISSSTIEEWGLYSALIFKNVSPEFLILHIGSNDFWDNKRETSVVKNSFAYLMNYMHSILPNTKIAICSVENRSYKMPHLIGIDDTIDVLKEYDVFVQNFVSQNDYMRYIDSVSHFCDENWMIITSKYRSDGTHPLAEEYYFFVEEAKKLGARINYVSE